MNKIILLLCFCFVASFNMKAQSDKNHHAYVTVFSMPIDTSLRPYNTFRVNAVVLENKKAEVISSLRLTGFLVKNNSDADLVIDYNETPFHVFSIDAQNIVREEESKGIKKKVTYYYAVVKYQHSISYSFHDKSGKVFEEGTYYDNGYREIKTSEYANYSSLKDAAAGVVADREKEETNGALNGISGKLQKKYCYTSKKIALLICSVKPKKFNYDGFNKATELALSGMNQLDSLNRLIKSPRNFDFSTFPDSYNPCLDKFKEAIALWQVELKESDMKDKKARIDKDLTYDLDINIAAVAILMHDFVTARKYLDDALVIRGAWASNYNNSYNEFLPLFQANYPGKF